MIFEKKKINIETLSEYLTQVRLDLNLSSDEVIKKTGIKRIFLEGLEKGNFKNLPADVYVYGFLRQLAAVYSISPQSLIEQFKKEKGILQQLEKEDDFIVGASYKKYFKKLIITPKILSMALGAAFVIVSIFYIIWQVWSIDKTPSLTITQPQDNSTILSSSIQVEGTTDPGINVSVNNEPVYVDSQGHFKTQLGVTSGPKQIVVTAKNRFDKSFSKTLNIIGQATNSFADSLLVKVDFSAPVTLGVFIDGQKEENLNFNTGDSKTFSASQKIVFSTTDAGATRITLNGQSLGPIGRPNEKLSNISFFAQQNSASSTTK